MKIEGHNTSSVTAETVEAKAEARLLLDENGRLREAITIARQQMDVNDFVGAYVTLTAILLGEKK